MTPRFIEAGRFAFEDVPDASEPERANPWLTLTRDWVPVRPVLVCEVDYDHFDGDRFRHGLRFKRWRPDRDAASCGFDQLR